MESLIFLYSSPLFSFSIMLVFSVFFLIFSDSCPISLEKAIIHLFPVHSYNFEDKFFTKFLSKLSLNDISIFWSAKLTRLTLVSSSYFNFTSFFLSHKLINSAKFIILSLFSWSSILFSMFKVSSWEKFLIWLIVLFLASKLISSLLTSSCSFLLISIEYFSWFRTSFFFYQ